MGHVDRDKLNTSERALYDAIQDKDHHSVLNVVQKDPEVNFDRMNGMVAPKTGQNTVDESDMNLLAAADESVAGHMLAHAIVEADAESKGAAAPPDAQDTLDVAGNVVRQGPRTAHDIASMAFGGGAGTRLSRSAVDVRVPSLGITIGITYAGSALHSDMTGVTVRKDQL